MKYLQDKVWNHFLLVLFLKNMSTNQDFNNKDNTVSHTKLTIWLICKEKDQYRGEKGWNHILQEVEAIELFDI